MDYPPMRGGVARYLSNLAEASEGQIKILVPVDHPASTEQITSQVSRVRFWWNGWPKWLPLIKRCLELKDGTIFVSHVLPVGTAAWISKMFGGPNYVVLFHGTDLKRISTPWRKWLLKRICAKAQRLIVNSQATSVALKKLISDADPLILTPGVKGLELTSKSSARANLNIAIESKLILAVGRLVERKGVDVLLQALARVIEEEPKTELAVIGRGEYAEPLHELAKLLKIPVRWVEDATDQDLARWYSAADIFCLPSREESDDVEGFGMVFLEAAMAGLPVVAGRGWGTEEAVLNDVTGLVVPPWKDPVAAALLKLLKDAELCRRMGQAGKERAMKDFQWRDRWLKLIGESKPQSDIAVVIPCWNHAVELEKTLEALSHQTLMPKEVIVVDNNSTDNPKAVVEKFKTKLPINSIFYNQKQGAPAARNEGARLTKAPYLLFLDSDVELVSDALQVMRKTLENHPEAAFAYSDFYWSHKLFRGQPWDDQALRHKNWIHTSSLIRRAAWLPFDETLKRFQDWDLWISMSKRGYTGVWIPRPLFKVAEAAREGKISHWVPAFVHRMPWPILGWTPEEIKRYKDAESILKKKHGIV
jgi:phosphatidylinositol alpha-1,6-mannosyltransferase